MFVVVFVVLPVPVVLLAVTREVQPDIHGLVLPVLLVVFYAITKRHRVRTSICNRLR